MDDKRYKTAFDSLKFSESFERDTITMLTRAADAQREKKNNENSQIL